MLLKIKPPHRLGEGENETNYAKKIKANSGLFFSLQPATGYIV